MTREKIIKDNIRFVYKIAASFYNCDKEDLIQAGIVGLLKAYKKYKPSSLAKFSTYAKDYIYGEMYLLVSKKMVKINKETLRLYKYIEKTRYEEAQILGYIPNNIELAKIINMPLEMIDFACMASQEILSYDADSEFNRNLEEIISIPEKVSLDDKMLLYSGLNKLNDIEKAIIKERYLKDETQENIARKLKMTQVMVSRLEKKGISKMREYMVS